ncbi:MAG TPA: hypothetical protein VFD92_15205 [Candidatus Binatia bacterium]|nr:hypothetical protein [Candidatus Binatia bacterium]
MIADEIETGGRGAGSASAPRRSPAAWMAAGLACLAAYGAACAWLTWPLAARIATHLPDSTPACRFDTLFTVWLLAYESHRLATAPLALAQATIYAPTANALFYGPTCAAALPWFAPTYWATGNPTLALNVLFLAGAALTATALHLVVRHWTGSHAAGAVAGTVLLTDRWLLWEFPPTAPIYALLFGFPVLFLLLARPTASWRRTLLAIPVVIGQALVHFGYVAPSVLGPLAALAAVRIARPRTRRAGLQVALVVGLGAAALAPELLAYRVVQRANPDLAEQTVWRGLAQPPTRLPGGLLDHQMPTAVVPAALVLIAIGGALAALRRDAPGDGGAPSHAWRQAWFWAIAGIALSLTPTVVVLGREIATPKAWAIAWLPFLARLRVPARLSLGAYVALGALAGLAFHEVARRARAALVARGARAAGAAAAAPWLLAAAFAAIAYAEYARGYGGPPVLRTPLPRAYPLQEAIDGRSPLLAFVRAQPGPLLELPVGPTGLLPHWHTRAMVRSIFHWRPLVNGYDSYWPADFPERMRLALALPAPDAVAALRSATGVTQVLVHLAEVSADERAAWEAAAGESARTDLRLVGRDGDDLLFATSGAAEAPAPPATAPPSR